MLTLELTLKQQWINVMIYDGKFFEFVFLNYGAIGVILFLAFITFLKLPNPWTHIKKMFGWMKTTRVAHYSPRDVLLSKIDYWINFKIMNIKMNDPGRQMLFRDILQLKFMQFREYVDCASNCVTENMTGQEMFHVVVEKFNETVDAYEREAIARGIPEVVMVKYSEWQLRSYEFTLRATEMICLSSGYGTNESRMQAIYSLITAMMELTIAEAEKTLTDLNGELTGIGYKGVICG